MGLFCQENDERSVLLPLNMTSYQMSLKVISIKVEMSALMDENGISDEATAKEV